jgi:hypothetical protein
MGAIDLWDLLADKSVADLLVMLMHAIRGS